MLSFYGCKKEFKEAPYANIEQFTVKIADNNVIKGGIQGDSIFVYWPAGISVPSHVTPQIRLSEGATISPASDVSVAFNSSTVYTVTAQNGDKKQYKLIPQINIPKPILTNHPFTGTTLELGYTLNFSGQYLLANDTTQTRIFMVDTASGEEIQVYLKDASVLNSIVLQVRMPLDGRVKVGKSYRGKFIVGNNTVLLPGTLTISDPTIYSVKGNYTFLEEGKDIPATSAFTFTYNRSEIAEKFFPGEYTQVEFRLTPTGQSSYRTFYAPLTGKTTDKLTFNLPPDIPAGTLNRIRIGFAPTEGESIPSEYVWTPTEKTTTKVVR
ncbi:hypothetical protein ACL9RF_01150 [Sphingobacterium sp. Mn56C]|uniref:hypothetical protein n=1 Tax=Sphingobacterium sp. Mn56C TaxID=3395261 RepID=UPI003BE7288D